MARLGLWPLRWKVGGVVCPTCIIQSSAPRLHLVRPHNNQELNVRKTRFIRHLVFESKIWSWIAQDGCWLQLTELGPDFSLGNAAATTPWDLARWVSSKGLTHSVPEPKSLYSRIYIWLGCGSAFDSGFDPVSLVLRYGRLDIDLKITAYLLLHWGRLWVYVRSDERPVSPVTVENHIICTFPAFYLSSRRAIS